MSDIVVRPASVAEDAVRTILNRHFDLMRATSPEESCHVMTADALMTADILLLAAQAGDSVLGVGALKMLGNAHGELKSMHTLAEARGRGVAQLILQALLDAARDGGLTRVSLETGTAEAFAPARALYQRHGFEVCPPFGEYVFDPLSVFMTRSL